MPVVTVVESSWFAEKMRPTAMYGVAVVVRI